MGEIASSRLYGGTSPAKCPTGNTGGAIIQEPISFPGGRFPKIYRPRLLIEIP